MKTDIIEVSGVNYPVRIFFEARKNSSASIGKSSINIRIPLSLNREEQFRSIMKMKQWAKESIQKNPPRKEAIKKYEDGEKLSVGNKEYLLSIKYKQKKSSSARFIKDVISLKISSGIPKERQQAHISTLLSRIIARQRLPELERKLHQLNKEHFQAKLNKIFFKNLHSRWGSCSEVGNINISTRLLFAPEDVLEYVCIHELAHLLEFNHSERFWSLISKVMPNYYEKEAWLKQRGENMTF